MRDYTATVARLRKARDELERRGIGDIAHDIGHAISELQSERSTDDDLLTTGEAARLLGVRSVNTVKRWAAEGILEGFRRGGRVLVSRSSVRQLLDDSRLAAHQRREQELDEVLAPFDAGGDLPPTPSATWDGRRPWQSDAARIR